MTNPKQCRPRNDQTGEIWRDLESLERSGEIRILATLVEISQVLALARDVSMEVITGAPLSQAQGFVYTKSIREVSPKNFDLMLI